MGLLVRSVAWLTIVLALLSAREPFAQAGSQTLVEENLALKIKNTALETEILSLQDRLNRLAAERDRHLTETDKVRATLGEIQKKLNEAAERMAELERRHEAARASAEKREADLRAELEAEREKAAALAQQLTVAEQKAKEAVEARESELKAVQAKLVPTPSPKPPPPPRISRAANAGQGGFVGSLSAVIDAYRADRDPTAAKAALLGNLGTVLSEADFERHLNALAEQKAISSWTKYGSEDTGLSYLLVTKVTDNQFVGVVNLSFAGLMNGKPAPISDMEAIDRFYPIEIRSELNWDQAQVSWLYEDGATIGSLPPDFAPRKTPWTIADYLRARSEATSIFASGGRRDSVRPVPLGELEKKAPEQFVRLAAAAGTTGHPKINAVMHMNRITLDPAVLTRGINFQEFDGLQQSVAAAFTGSLTREQRKKGVADALYGRLAALILMPEFAIESVAALDTDRVRLHSSYLDAGGRRQKATIDFRKGANGEGWLPAALSRETATAAER